MPPATMYPSSSRSIKDTTQAVRNPVSNVLPKKGSSFLSFLKAWIRRGTKEDTDIFNMDVFVVCLGAPGSGKSSFIEKAASVPNIVGHGLESKTQEIKDYELPRPELFPSKLFLVDTPGFDDANDGQMISRLEAWLSARGSRTIFVLYFHSIMERRRPRGTLHPLLFKDLCEGDFKRMALITTHWDKVKNDHEANTREEGMKKTYWTAMIECGLPVERFRNTGDSAREILDEILKKANEMTAAAHSAHLEAKITELKQTVKRNSRHNILRDLESGAFNLLKKEEALRKTLREQVFDPDARQQQMEDYQRTLEAIYCGFKDAKKLSKSGNIISLGRLQQIFSTKFNRKGKAPLIGGHDSDVLQPNNSDGLSGLGPIRRQN